MSHTPYSQRSIPRSSAALLSGLAVGSLLTACGGAALATPTLAAGTSVPAAGGAPRTLQLVQATGMVEAADAEFKRQVAAWGQANNAAVNVEIAASQAMGAKISAAVNTQPGPDIILLQGYESWQNAASLADVTRDAEALKGQIGGAYDGIDANCKVKGAYRAVPFTFFPSGRIAPGGHPLHVLRRPHHPGPDRRLGARVSDRRHGAFAVGR
jgi:ABC-type glycerol-3-phosphate transport system substrate-binding protein